MDDLPVEARLPCDHGRYDPHTIKGERGHFTKQRCPGGPPLLIQLRTVLLNGTDPIIVWISDYAHMEK